MLSAARFCASISRYLWPRLCHGWEESVRPPRSTSNCRASCASAPAHDRAKQQNSNKRVSFCIRGDNYRVALVCVANNYNLTSKAIVYSLKSSMSNYMHAAIICAAAIRASPGMIMRSALLRTLMR